MNSACGNACSNSAGSFEAVVVEPQVVPQGFETCAAIQGQGEDRADVGARAVRRAFAQKAQAPAPLRGIGAQSPEQGRILAAQPPEDFQWRVRIRPGLGMARRDLPAVGEAGFARRAGLAIDHDDLMAILDEEPSRGDTDQTGTQHYNAHAQPTETKNG
jgi:hypothetical protein